MHSPEMRKADALATLFSHTLVAVIRETDAPRAARLAEGIVEGGFRALEITTTTPGWLDLLQNLAGSDGTLMLGAGTIRSTGQVERAEGRGARFVVQPHAERALIESALARGLISIPGALTPSEVVNAGRLGADVVKIYPITAVGGASYVSMIRGPFPEVRLWVSGSVALEEIGDYLSAGAELIGLTSHLTGDLPGDPKNGARMRAERAIQEVAHFRGGRPLLTLSGPKDRLILRFDDFASVRGATQIALDSVVPGRRGHAVALAPFLARAGITAEDQCNVRSADGGFSRALSAAVLYQGGYLHYATDSRPLRVSDGGPLRLYVVGGSAQCDNVKALSEVEVVRS